MCYLVEARLYGAVPRPEDEARVEIDAKFRNPDPGTAKS